jgi:hypothetical protein
VEMTLHNGHILLSAAFHLQLQVAFQAPRQAMGRG